MQASTVPLWSVSSSISTSPTRPAGVRVSRTSSLPFRLRGELQLAFVAGLDGAQVGAHEARHRVAIDVLGVGLDRLLRDGAGDVRAVLVAQVDGAAASGAELSELRGRACTGAAAAAQTGVRAVDGHAVDSLEGLVDALARTALAKQIDDAAGLVRRHGPDHADETNPVELRAWSCRARSAMRTRSRAANRLRLLGRRGDERDPAGEADAFGDLVDVIRHVRSPPRHRRDQPEVAGERKHEQGEEEPVDDLKPTAKPAAPGAPRQPSG